MAKMVTPEMTAINKKNASRRKKSLGSSPAAEAWKRLRRNRTAVLGMVIIIILVLLAIFADVIAPYDYAEQDYSAVKLGPCLAHPFGTDNMGRDILSRCLYGARYSLPIGFVCVICALLLGGSLGFICAYFGGKTDNIIMRVMDVFASIPPTLMAIAIVAALGDGMVQLIFAITISFMSGTARICRAAIFTVKRSEFITSSRAIGAGGFRLLVRHMIPNALAPIIIECVNMLAGSVLIVSGLSYLGLGLTPPTPEWGVLLSGGKDFLTSAPHMVIFPGLCIMITVFAFNLFGDGLRDALDPRLK